MMLFFKGDFQDWARFALLDILRGYNNNGRYEESLAKSKSVFDIAKEMNDTLLMEEVLTLTGTSRYSLADYKGALADYYDAYKLDPTIINARHAFNITIAASELYPDSLPEKIRHFIDEIKPRKEIIPPFQQLAEDGKFQEAYYGIMLYKEMQDSVLKALLHGNVSESIAKYEAMKKTAMNQRQRSERHLWTGVVLVLILIGAVIAWGYKNHLNKNNIERKRLEDSLEILRTDLSTQVKNMEVMAVSNQEICEKYEIVSSYLKDYLYDKYKRVNDLCDSYFQDRLVKSKNSGLEKDMKSLLKNLSDPVFIKEICTHIDRCMDGLYSSFISDFPDLSEDARRLFIFLTLGFSSRTICVIFGIETTILYNRKSRLKKILSSANTLRKQEYLKNISR